MIHDNWTSRDDLVRIQVYADIVGSTEGPNSLWSHLAEVGLACLLVAAVGYAASTVARPVML